MEYQNINKILLASINPHFYGLANGKMGLCVYFYHLSRLENQPECESIAERLLDEVIENISLNNSIGVGTGLSGIAIGIDHLINEKFIIGDVNEILREIDDVIFKAIAFEDKITKDRTIDYILLLYYLYIRYAKQVDDESFYIYNELIVKTIENTYQAISFDFFDEPTSFSSHYKLPLFLYVLSRIISLDIYNYRILKIIGELKNKILGIFPVSHGNRLYLLCGLLSVNVYLKDSDYTKHIELLRGNIDLQRILYNEFINKQVFIKKGLSLLFILLLFLEKEFSDYAIVFDKKALYDRIADSEVWNMEKRVDNDYFFGLYSGIPGTILILSYLKNKYKLCV